MTLHIAAVYLALIIPLGSSDPIIMDFGVYPAVGLPISPTYMSGMATPVGYWYSTVWAPDNVHEHELIHIDQMEALGVWFFPAYVVNPRFFESYETDGVFGEVTHHDLTLHQMWRPPSDIKRQSPQFRVTFNPGNTNVQFLPAYRFW